ncbi:uncharacterized protein PHACADRAFT_207380 [Phanerochaete carnosa HHB-10118-sp]|uniref:Enoyl reductase (ER) domain-containing protein n=1 Tax=Phanerochaete carnosa (strain HHB-10118-sp) TaxID=650164 RepID=K5WGV0_PHACS|nr:uncharacterized protein PHACADRAFT_207380 [Phanerochaete carnosa HHB-10118-sp]EKM58560.1 hypothetical protein PHACADRAFT_207380 [Phanerochaete carnosa HHB-10118-sp]
MARQQKLLLLSGPAGQFTVESRDVPNPGPGFLLIELHAIALNPADWLLRDLGLWITQWPAVLGLDAAGVVAEVGRGVTNVAVGDRVMYAGTGEEPRVSTFQQYNVVCAEFVAKIPDSMTFDQAATIPITMATAALGLYDKQQEPDGGLGLTPPWEAEGGRGKYAGEPIFITGGASGVGQHAIQFAKMSGFAPIITTASLHNEAYLKSLGATHVIDRALPAASLVQAVQDITPKPVRVAYDTVSQPDVQNAMYNLLAPGGRMLRVGPMLVHEESLTKDKYVAHVFAGVQRPAQQECGRALYAKLPEMLAAGDIKPTRVELLPNGLVGIPDGLDRLKSGVSGVKYVVRPQETP